MALADHKRTKTTNEYGLNNRYRSIKEGSCNQSTEKTLGDSARKVLYDKSGSQSTALKTKTAGSSTQHIPTTMYQKNRGMAAAA